MKKRTVSMIANPSSFSAPIVPQGGPETRTANERRPGPQGGPRIQRAQVNYVSNGQQLLMSSSCADHAFGLCSLAPRSGAMRRV